MRSRRGTAVLLAGIWAFGTGASVDGVRDARRWQHAADLAAAIGDPEIAYAFYEKTARTFPDTRHGQLAASRGRAMKGRLKAPARSPASEGADFWVGELFDFLTWP